MLTATEIEEASKADPSPERRRIKPDKQYEIMQSVKEILYVFKSKTSTNKINPELAYVKESNKTTDKLETSGHSCSNHLEFVLD